MKSYIQVTALRADNKADRQSKDKGWAELSVFHTSNLTLQILQLSRKKEEKKVLYWNSFFIFLINNKHKLLIKRFS